MFDFKNEIGNRFEKLLRQEIDLLLGKQYQVKYRDNILLLADWSQQSAINNYQVLEADPDVDIIIAVGTMTASTLAKQEAFAKPTILLGILDYKLQQVPLTVDKTSGRQNLNYILDAGEFGKDLDLFHEVFPYRNLAIVADRKLLDLVPDIESIMVDYITAKGSQAKILEYDGDINPVLDQLTTEFDAVYYGGLYALGNIEKQALIDHVNRLKLPSYAFQGVADVRRGALAGAAPETNWQKVGRRIALNVERILNGQDPAELPTLMDFARTLTLNMKTAERIDYSPTWEILARADKIAADKIISERVLGFESAVREALHNNLNLEIEGKSLQSSLQEVARVRSALLPTVSASASITRIDAEHAGAIQAEETTGGNLALNQIFYSESAWANLAAQKYRYQSAEEIYRQVTLDTVLEVSRKFLDVLKEQNNVRINQNNVALVKKNHEIATYRNRVGYSGAADIYRLDSELASAQSSLNAVESRLKQAVIELNDFTGGPLSAELTLLETNLGEVVMSRYGMEQIRQAVSNPKALELLTRFLAEEAMRTAPELAQVRAALAAQERLQASSERRRWLPSVSLSAGVSEVFDRDGVGSGTANADDTSWNVSLGANWELFSGGGIFAEQKQARIERDEFRLRLKNLERTVERELRSRMFELRYQESNLNLARKAAEAAQQSYELVQDAYKQGSVTITALLDAQNSALIAEQSAANSVYDYYFAFLKVERALGSFSVTSSQDEQKDFFERFDIYMKRNQGY